jgi:SH3-like domain-containing protein
VISTHLSPFPAIVGWALEGSIMRSAVSGLVAALCLFVALMPWASPVSAHQRDYQELCVVAHEDMEMILLRDGPGTQHLAFRRLHPGWCSVYLVDHCRKGWCPVVYGEFDGWVRARNLVAKPTPDVCSAPIVAAAQLELRTRPSYNSRVILTVAATDCGVVILPERVGDWRRARIGAHDGWVKVTSLR